MLKRLITSKLIERLKHTPAVALLGPRQVGKTTLALEIADLYPSIFLDLESPESITKLSNPEAYLSQQSEKLIILDEIQRIPDLFPVLRGLIDKGRGAGREGEQFLILGSASRDLLKQSSESLAGRISYLELFVLNILEIQEKTPRDQSKLWLRGGFPKSFLAESDGISADWRYDFIQTYLERDIPQMGFQIPAARLQRLWTMLAHLQGETINASQLAASLETSSKTVSYYIDILTDLLLVRQLQPFHANVKKRLVKSPRVYIRDSGILHRLLNIVDEDELLSHPINGKSWEGFVIENLLSVAPYTVKPYFYRTQAGAEIDLILQISAQELWAIEIKKGLAPKIPPGFHQACEDIEVSHKFVVYGGQDEFPVEQGTNVISLSRLMHKLTNLP